MRPSRIFRAIARRVVNRAFGLFGIDVLSGARIVGRDDLVAIGTVYGGWVVPADLLDADSICYCVGCGEDISFDLGLIERFGCEVHGFDPTPRAIEYVERVAGGDMGYRFHALGLWDAADRLRFYVPRNPAHVSHSLLNLQKTDEYITVDVERLSAIMRGLGHDRLTLLKLDIEGAEYRVIESILEDGLVVDVLCVEYDESFNPLDAGYRERIRASVDALLRHGYRLVHSAGNGNYTFVREGAARRAVPRESGKQGAVDRSSRS